MYVVELELVIKGTSICGHLFQLTMRSVTCLSSMLVMKRGTITYFMKNLKHIYILNPVILEKVKLRVRFCYVYSDVLPVDSAFR